ncbi:MAG: beta-lactamase family protein [Acidimicrobiia bacterium]|nr:beta-lactamase family protein [Acidimicrobiia bacterium]
MAQLNGTWKPEFMAVYRAFEENFASRSEVGASLHVTVGGETVVDLWGGTVADPARHPDAAPWQEDTLVTVFSSTKGATAIAGHVLVSRGELDLDAPIGEVWPGFARNGKESATVRMLFDHSVGVPTWRDKVPVGAVTDWDEMVRRLEEEPPFWEPGTRNGYHMLSFGWLVGELVRRTSGRSLGRFFADEVAGPTGAGRDCYIGLPESEHGRVSKVIPFVPDRDSPSAFTAAIRADRDSISAKALLNQGGFNPNDPACWSAEIGGAGGVANGRGLARIYAPLANGGADLVDADTLARMGEVAVATELDATLLLPTRFALGFMKSMDNRRRRRGDRDSVILGSAAFGHVGAGGSIGFADPDCQMSFGYAMNRMGEGILLNDRGQALVDAVYRCLGYRGNASGVWSR